MRCHFYASLALAAIFAAAVSSQNSSSAFPTINMFINDALEGEAEYAASIVTAFTDHTVYAIHCTSGPVGIGTETCGPDAETVTMTEGPSTYIVASTVTTEVQGYTAVAAISAGCALLGTTAASCVEYASVSIDGTSSKVTTSTLLTGAAYHRFDVAITGGAEKTAEATAASTAASESGAMSLSAREGMALGAVLAAGIAGMMTM